MEKKDKGGIRSPTVIHLLKWPQTKQKSGAAKIFVQHPFREVINGKFGPNDC